MKDIYTMSGYLKIFLVVFFSTIIGCVFGLVLGTLNLEYSTLLLIIQATVTLLLIILWVLKSERDKDKSLQKEQRT